MLPDIKLVISIGTPQTAALIYFVYFLSLSAGITTPDRNEASVKSAAVQNSQTIYVLADHSKFGHIASVTFAQLGRVKIITDKLQDKKYHTKANIKEVM